MLNRQMILNCARIRGFDLCGVARSRRLDEHGSFLAEWLAQGRHGGIGYMERGTERRFDPTALHEGAQTVIVCAVSYNRGLASRMANSGNPKIASYALSADYHEVIGGMLGELLDDMRREHPGLSGRCFTDTAPILEKAWAVEAGLGWIGRNSLLITPDYGSFVLLGGIVVDAGADSYDTPFGRGLCGTCRRCVDACPNGAIIPEGGIDTRKCIARLTIEKPAAEGRGDAEKPKLHGWIFGCDECQNACPHNLRALPATCAALEPTAAPEELTSRFWQELSEGEFGQRFGRTPLARAGLERLKGYL